MTDTMVTYLQSHPYKAYRNIDLYILSSIDRYPPYRWGRATIEEIKSSGSLRYFSDDRIIKAISAYDAFTHHMDEDQQTDDEMANRVSSIRAQIVDMGYSKEITMGLRNNIDSMMKNPSLQELAAKDEHALIAKDSFSVKVFENEKINLRKHLMIRAEEELPQLKNDAVKLITMLKTEFNFRD